jgi:branched-chain amino acid transport system permease protein
VPLVVTNNYYLDSIIVCFFWGSMAAAWNLVGGYAGQLSLGHTAFFGIGAYASSILFARYALTPWLGLLVGAALAAVFAVFVGLVCFRLRGPFFALVTIAFAEVGLIVASSLRDLTKGTEGFNIPFRPAFENMLFRGKVGYFYLFLGYAMLLYVISRAVEESKLGYSLIAFREDEEAARMLGVPTVRVRLIALGASAALTAVGGTLYAQYYQFLDPASTFGINFSIQVALLTMVGGIGTAAGPFFGALLMTPLGQFFRAWLGGGAAGLYLALYGIALILVVLFLPNGIVPEVRRRLGGRAHAEADDDAA